LARLVSVFKVGESARAATAAVSSVAPRRALAAY
jgi:hypothetical protein